MRSFLTMDTIKIIQGSLFIFVLQTRIPNSFSGTIFNHHKLVRLIQSLQIFIFFFLLSLIEVKITNKYLKNVSTSPIDITQKQFDDSAICSFNPAKLDLFGADKAFMSAAVIHCLGHISNISNPHFVRNADAFSSQKEVEVPLDWIEDKKNV